MGSDVLLIHPSIGIMKTNTISERDPVRPVAEQSGAQPEQLEEHDDGCGDNRQQRVERHHFRPLRQRPHRFKREQAADRHHDEEQHFVDGDAVREVRIRS